MHAAASRNNGQELAAERKHAPRALLFFCCSLLNDSREREAKLLLPTITLEPAPHEETTIKIKQKQEQERFPYTLAFTSALRLRLWLLSHGYYLLW